MKEELLHLIWKMKKFDHADLQTTAGEKVQIINYGIHNHDAGPDFLNAVVKIGSTTWHGHVEIHVKASEWNDHKHQLDPAYDNVILHVVYKNNKPVFNKQNIAIATLTLEERLTQRVLDQYDLLSQSLKWVPCASSLENYDNALINLYLHRLLVERLENKIKYVNILLKESENDWEHILFCMISKYLGLKVNRTAFEKLSASCPYKIINKLTHKPFQLEALFFGQAGLLKKGNDEYFLKLKKEFAHLKNKFQLVPMTGLEWKFSRMRPFNFPTLRISQLASLYHTTPQLFSQILTIEKVDDVFKLLSVKASNYWNTRYVPDKEGAYLEKRLGKEAQKTIIINAIAPLLFIYGVKSKNQKYKDRAISFLENLSAEKNQIIRNWKKLGIECKTAFQSQALIELKGQYCDQFRCLNCNIGRSILFK